MKACISFRMSLKAFHSCRHENKGPIITNNGGKLHNKRYSSNISESYMTKKNETVNCKRIH